MKSSLLIAELCFFLVDDVMTYIKVARSTVFNSLNSTVKLWQLFLLILLIKKSINRLLRQKAAKIKTQNIQWKLQKQYTHLDTDKKTSKQISDLVFHFSTYLCKDIITLTELVDGTDK